VDEDDCRKGKDQPGFDRETWDQVVGAGDEMTAQRRRACFGDGLSGKEEFETTTAGSFLSRLETGVCLAFEIRFFSAYGKKAESLSLRSSSGGSQHRFRVAKERIDAHFFTHSK
jgi:hypothetical protein